MKLLVDTQCWLWMNVSPERFSDRTRALLLDPKTVRMLSAASVWEIGIKYHLGKLALPGRADRLRSSPTGTDPDRAAPDLRRPCFARRRLAAAPSRSF